MTDAGGPNVLRYVTALAKPCHYPYLTVANPGNGGSIGGGKTLRTAKTKKGRRVRELREKIPLWDQNWQSQMNSLAASVKLTYSTSMVDRLTDFCLKVRHEIGVSSIKVMNPPIDTRSSLFVAKI
ncbi:hypothetical protein TNCV_752891 [Trichonephila clavipes]|uniref:Uncharacterized protein n=1 Tax=Trichonephila clavipes TaxID=2585209 RepID=A0A8X6WC12_TRICX|nr:hypothetical protein TNCV_752891 [Trichonephila clavipes]